MKYINNKILNRIISTIHCIFFTFFSLLSIAQNTNDIKSDTSGKKLIHIIYADYLEFLDIEQNNPIRRLVGKVQLEHNSSTFYCDSTDLFLKQNKIKAYYNINIKHNDGTNIWSDFLDYNCNSKDALLTGKVKLTKENASLETQSLQYNTNSKIAIFNNNGILKKDSTIIYSKSGTYNANNDDAQFEGNVIIQNPSYNIISEKIKFNTQTNVITFLSPTTIHKGKTKVYCEDGWYNTQTEEGFFKKNAKVIDPPNVLQGDEIYYNSKTKQGKVNGNVSIIDSIKQTKLSTKNLNYNADTKTYIATDSVTYIDIKKEITTQGNKITFNDSTKYMHIEGNGIIDAKKDKTKIWGDNIIYNDSLKIFHTSQNALMAFNLDTDTLWISADTLNYKGKNKNQNDTIKGVFKAFHHVKIFKTDLQGFCDSLFYNDSDSTFTFFNSPIFWNENTQFTADSIQVQLKNKKPNKINLLENAFIISKTDTAALFQQIKGKRAIIFLLNSKLNQVKVQENSEAIYYAQDDKKGFIGVNKAISTNMRIDFKEKNTINKIVLIGNPESDFIPIKQAVQEKMTLKGFQWRIAQKPNSKYEILQGLSKHYTF
jgi:lipopolysaccharide export system protein LptA